MRPPLPKTRWAAFFAALDENDLEPAPNTWAASIWLLLMPPGVVAVWLLFLRLR